MIVEPERFLETFSEAGADQLLVQSEPSSTVHLHRVLSRFRELGKKAGAVLDPASPIAFAEQVLHLCDVILDAQVILHHFRISAHAHRRPDRASSGSRP
jgi:ribulose-phosphate 3-epimerase